MSGIFFDGLGIPPADFNLEVGSGSHGVQTGSMLSGIEGVLEKARPDRVLIYGDTNSTLAGALAAAKLHIPVAHVEAGLRSFNRQMPEEINRVVADHLSSILLCPSKTAVADLAAEGITGNVHLVGDVMLDVLNWAVQRVTANPPDLAAQLGVAPKAYLVATIHRSENADDNGRLSRILAAFNHLEEPIVFPAHPRTRKSILALGCPIASQIKIIEPLGYLDMIALVRGARLILTDSGGLQKEAYWLGVPCVTVREETEWVETVEAGWNTLAGTDKEKIVHAVASCRPPGQRPSLYGNGRAAEQCIEAITH
jgi:UDP-GlcNAc3NAcA epimerase